MHVNYLEQVLKAGAKRVTPDAIQKWKEEKGYDKPLLWNSDRKDFAKITETIFFEKSVRPIYRRLER